MCVPQVETVGERIVLYILNRVIYRAKEMSSEEELPFLCHGEKDNAKICWNNGEAVGFYSVKPSGNLCYLWIYVMKNTFLSKCSLVLRFCIDVRNGLFTAKGEDNLEETNWCLILSRICLFAFKRCCCNVFITLPFDTCPHEYASWVIVSLVGSLCNSFSTRSYQLPVMDSIFVRKCHRGKGFGLQMLEDFVFSFKEEYLGLRYPLTKAMYKGM